MAGFKFRLQQVFEYRQHLEKDQKDKHAAARRILSDLEETAAQLAERRRYWSRRYLDSSLKGMTPIEAININAYLSELDRLLEENQKQIIRQTALVEQERQELVLRMQERKTMEALHDKQKARYEEEYRHKEEKALDDFISGNVAQLAG